MSKVESFEEGIKNAKSARFSKGLPTVNLVEMLTRHGADITGEDLGQEFDR